MSAPRAQEGLLLTPQVLLNPQRPCMRITVTLAQAGVDSPSGYTPLCLNYRSETKSDCTHVRPKV